MKAIAISKQGSRSEDNEDACIALNGVGVYAVADGVGGGPAGELASRCVVDVLTNAFRKKKVSGRRIESAIEQANNSIRDVAAKLKHEGMASTIALAWLSDDKLHCYHVGDSRIYRMRDGRVVQLTRDHTKVVKRANGSVKSVITQAMGAQEVVYPDVTEHHWQMGDILLIMSDGISDVVPETEMESLLSDNNLTMSDKAWSLIARSEQLGGTDDKTVILVFS